jgi:hypothetical protein
MAKQNGERIDRGEAGFDTNRTGDRCMAFRAGALPYGRA